MAGYGATTEAKLELELAGAGRRFVAQLIDGFILGFVCSLVSVPLLLATYRRLVSQALSDPESFSLDALGTAPLLIVLVELLVGFFYYVILHAWRGQTLGKMALGIRVVTESGQVPSLGTSLLRSIGYWLSALPLDLGYIWILVDPNKQGWHDKIARTYVVRARQYATVRPTRQYVAPPPHHEQPRATGPMQRTATPPPRKPGTREPAGAALVVLEGAQQGHEYHLPGGDARIGRQRQGNDIVLSGDRCVSREHALVREEHGHYTLFDRGSTTGTYVNGHPVKGPVLLHHGDEITMGQTRLRFVKLG